MSTHLELPPGLDDVGQQQREAAVIIQPPHVNMSRPLLLAELDDLVHSLDNQTWTLQPITPSVTTLTDLITLVSRG